MGLTKIVVRGARQHNLKNISLAIPRSTLTVVTGLSGSGKSSLAFDTIYAEGQRRYVESLSAYARQFLDQMERPEVDSIEGLSPAIAYADQQLIIPVQQSVPSSPSSDGMDGGKVLAIGAGIVIGAAASAAVACSLSCSARM